MKKIPLLMLTFFLMNFSYAQVAIHIDNTYANVAFQSAKKVAYLEMYRSLTEDIHQAKDKTMKNYVIVDMVQDRIYKSLNEVDDAMAKAKSAYHAGQQLVSIAENIAEAGKLAANKPYLLAYWRKMGPIMIGKSTELYKFMTEYIQKNQKDVLMNKTARDMFLYRTFQDINAIHALSQVMVIDFKRVTLAESVNSVVPYQHYINTDKSIINSTIRRLNGLL